MDTVLQVIYENYKGEDREVLVRAYHYAEEAHSGQKRASGEAYFIHPCAVAKILMELGLDSADGRGGAFARRDRGHARHRRGHHARISGTRCSELVSGVTKLDKIVFKSQGAGGSGKLPQNFRRHGEGYPRHHHQTCRPPAQYALAEFPFHRAAAENGAGNAGHLSRRSRAGWVFRRSSASWKICA